MNEKLKVGYSAKGATVARSILCKDLRIVFANLYSNYNLCICI